MIRVSELRKVYHGRGHRSHVVLDGIDFEVPRGFKLALLGRNGAGKSTLIRLLGKIEMPTSGTVHHGMSVSWPLGFGGAFQGSLSGLDNMRFISRIYRTDYEQTRKMVEDFAELGDFLYEPVKTYSSGMQARLAFALSIAIDFDCYLIDEVVMVGDQRFHARCREHLFNKSAGRALVVASHDAHFVRDVCNAAIVLIKGKAHYYDSVDDAVNVYQAL